MFYGDKMQFFVINNFFLLKMLMYLNQYSNAYIDSGLLKYKYMNNYTKDNNL